MERDTNTVKEWAEAQITRLIWSARLTAAMYALWRYEMFCMEFGEEPSCEE